MPPKPTKKEAESMAHYFIGSRPDPRVQAQIEQQLVSLATDRDFYNAVNRQAYGLLPAMDGDRVLLEAPERFPGAVIPIGGADVGWGLFAPVLALTSNYGGGGVREIIDGSPFEWPRPTQGEPFDLFGEITFIARTFARPVFYVADSDTDWIDRIRPRLRVAFPRLLEEGVVTADDIAGKLFRSNWNVARVSDHSSLHVHTVSDRPLPLEGGMRCYGIGSRRYYGSRSPIMAGPTSALHRI